MIIRPAREEDLPAIARVHVDTWRITYAGLIPDDFLASLSYESREQMWRGTITDSEGRSSLFVAQDLAGHITGFASCGAERDGDSVYTGELYAIYVDQMAQGKGIGRSLVQSVARDLVQRGHTSLLIWVLANNPYRLFYEALGGVAVKHKDITFGKATLAEVAYGWPDIQSLT